MARKLVVEIVGDTSSLERSLKTAGDHVNRTSKHLSGLAKAAAFAAGGAGIGLLAVGLKGVVSAAEESQAAQTRLQDALAKSGVSYAEHGKAIDAAIQKTSQLAALDDEDLSDAFSKLVRTSGNVKESIEGMNIAADIARARHISLEAATKMVEKAMNGSASAFKRVGLEVDKNATSTEILQAAQQRFAGSAEAYGKTAAGAQQRLSVAFENLQETVGQKVLPVLASFFEMLNRVIAFIQLHWPEVQATFQKTATRIKDIWQTDLQPTFELIRAIVTRVINQLIPVLEGLWQTFKGIVDLVGDLIHGRWANVWGDLKEIASGALKAVVAVLQAALSDVGLLAKKMGEALYDGLVGGLKGIGHALAQALRAALNYLIDQWNAFKIHVDAVKVFGVTVFPAVDIPLPNIPHLAKGGIVNSPTLALIGENGPEAVVPLGKGGGMGTTVNVTVNGWVGNDQQIATKVREELTKMVRGGTQLGFV